MKAELLKYPTPEFKYFQKNPLKLHQFLFYAADIKCPLWALVTHITHGDLVHSRLQNFWSIWHNMNAGLLFVPFIGVEPLQLQSHI